MLPIGIQLYAVGGDIKKGAPTALRQVAAIRYKEVETAGFGFLGIAAEFREALEDNAHHDILPTAVWRDLQDF